MEIINKGRRHELKMLKYKKRLKNYNISPEKESNPNNNFSAFRSHGKPCSCWACTGEKYNRAFNKVNIMKDGIEPLKDGDTLRDVEGL